MLATGKSSTNGFTLIEALVVVAIAGLIAGLVFPRVDRAILRQQFRTSEAVIVQSLRQTRAMAIRTGQTTHFALARGGRLISVDGVAQPPLGDGVAVAPIDRAALRYFADGSSDGGRFALTAPHRRELITVYPSTGVVTTTRRE